MKRIFSVLFSLFVLIGFTVGCSSSSTKSTSKDNQGKTEITFWRHDFGTENKAFKKLIKSFEKKNPNINVKFKTFPYESYETKIRTALAGQKAPDIIALDAPTIASYASNQAVIPLDKYMKDKDYDKNDIFKPVLNAMTYKGKIYAAPNNDASLAVFYNKKMFKEAGIPLPPKDPDKAWTWDQALNAAKKLNKLKKGVYGFQPVDLGSGEAAAFAEEPFIWQTGAQILGPDNKTAEGYLDSKEAKKAYKFFQKLYVTDKVAPKEAPEDGLQNGKVAMAITGSFAIDDIKHNYSKFKLGRDYDITPLFKNKKQVTPNGSWNMAITSQSKHPDAAWKFIKWVTGKKGENEWYKDTGNLPARKSVIEDNKELQEYPWNIFVKQSKKYAHPRPVTPAYPQISDAIQKSFQQIALKNESINDVTKNAVEKINKALAEEQK